VIKVATMTDEEQYLHELEEKAEADWETDWHTAYCRGVRSARRKYQEERRQHEARERQYQARDRQQLARIAELERQLAARSSQA
jgi:hypothetical protein